MKLLKKQLPDSHNIFLFSDLHIGNLLFHASGFRKLVSQMNGSYRSCINNYGIFLGDAIEAITIDDPRFDFATQKIPFPLLQMKEIVKLAGPISTRILTWLEGNHERKMWRFGPISEEIAERLGVEFGTYSAKLAIQAQNKTATPMYKIFVTHGSKQVTSTADDPKRRFVNQRLILKRHLKSQFGDCVIMAKGHTHKLLVCDPEEELYLVDNGNKIVQKYITSSQKADYIHPDHRYYINSGSFLRLYREGVSGYAERAEYVPNELGYAIVRVRDRIVAGVDKIVLK